MFDMAASPCIQCRIDPQIKLRLQAIATERGLTESAVLKRLVIAAIGMAPANDAKVLAVKRIGPRARVYVRLQRSDHALLRERADARGLAAATYVSMLGRTHGEVAIGERRDVLQVSTNQHRDVGGRRQSTGGSAFAK